MEESFDLKEFAGHLDRIFPGLVKMSQQTGDITVMDRVRVTASGVVEGSGPAAEKVKTIYEEYIKQRSREHKGMGSLSQQVTRTRNPFRCAHCGLRLTAGRVYRRTIGGSVSLFCCKQCADHHETESPKIGIK